MAKKKAKKPAARSTKAKTSDLPGQKTMPHGPAKVREMEDAGQQYAELKARKQRAADDLKDHLGTIGDVMKRKKLLEYTVAGYRFVRDTEAKLLIKKVKNQ